jgi:hypothetical protein
MPVNPAVPEPLKTALESMEAQVQSTKKSLAFAAPEMHDTFWINLQMNLAGTMQTLYEQMRES